MDLGEIPPVSDIPSDVPTEETKKEMADHTPSQRNVYLYERTIADVTKIRDEYRQRVSLLEEKIANDLPFAIKLEEVKGRLSEATTQHILSTVLVGFGALGMGIFSEISEPKRYWASVTVAVVAIVLGILTKPISCVVRWWHSK